MDRGLDASYAAARSIMREHAHTFYFASVWLRPDRRRATHALYAFFRTLDDLVDETSTGALDPASARHELDRWRAWLHCPESQHRAEPHLPAVLDTLNRYAIPRRHFLDLIDGLEMDLCGTRYEDFGALALYCYRVASTVGLAMCHVLGASDPRAVGLAAELGVAMQITNILRDVREDYCMGRVYLPHDLLHSAGWNDARLERGVPDDAFRSLVRTLIAYARLYYRRGERGLPYLSADARLAILMASRCYAGILKQIERANYDVFRQRAHVSGTGKAAIALRTALWPRLPRGPLPELPPGAPSGESLIRLAGGLPATGSVPSLSSPAPQTSDPALPSASP
jgi:15-cis-phytoene synthase